MKNHPLTLALRLSTIPLPVLDETLKSAQEISKKIKFEIEQYPDKSYAIRAFHDIKNDIRIRENMYSRILKNNDPFEPFHVFRGALEGTLHCRFSVPLDDINEYDIKSFETALKEIPMTHPALIAAYQPAGLLRKMNRIKDEWEFSSSLKNSGKK